MHVKRQKKKILGHGQPQKRNGWYDEEYQEALKLRNEMRIKMLHRNTRKNVDEFKEARREAKTLIKKKKKEYEENIQMRDVRFEAVCRKKEEKEQTQRQAILWKASRMEVSISSKSVKSTIDFISFKKSLPVPSRGAFSSLKDEPHTVEYKQVFYHCSKMQSPSPNCSSRVVDDHLLADKEARKRQKFRSTLTNVELAAWCALKPVVEGFLCNRNNGQQNL
ncbi:hypothetical protein C0J52_22751 [Blattella germanica]|nr:hypothetical protein C0J52_22751 [Blattella germanica]